MIPKFRAWVKSYEVMCEPEKVDFCYADGNVHWVDCWFADEKFEFSPDEVELLQWTGLKDKNSVDIYEGDVVYLVIFEDNAGYMGIIVFENGGFSYEVKHDGETHRIPLQTISEENTILKVLGNNYENPELLEVTE